MGDVRIRTRALQETSRGKPTDLGQQAYHHDFLNVRIPHEPLHAAAAVGNQDAEASNHDHTGLCLPRMVKLLDDADERHVLHFVEVGQTAWGRGRVVHQLPARLWKESGGVGVCTNGAWGGGGSLPTGMPSHGNAYLSPDKLCSGVGGCSPCGRRCGGSSRGGGNRGHRAAERGPRRRSSGTAGAGGPAQVRGPRPGGGSRRTCGRTEQQVRHWYGVCCGEWMCVYVLCGCCVTTFLWCRGVTVRVITRRTREAEVWGRRRVWEGGWARRVDEKTG